MTISAKQFGHLFDPNKGGFSVNTQTGESPKSGYMVALSGSEKTLPSAMIHPSDLDQYRQDHINQLNATDRYFGGWNDTGRGQVDLDTSVNMPGGGPINQAAAHVAMIRHGQRSLYNVDTDDLEWNAHYGKSVETAHADIKSQYDEAAREYR